MNKILTGEILGPEDDEQRESRVRRGFWKTFRRAARAIPFSEDVVAAYYCALDPETPARARAILLGALVYFVMPVDAVPDILAGIGFTDDASVLLAAFAAVSMHIKDRHRAAARAKMSEESGENTRERWT